MIKKDFPSSVQIQTSNKCNAACRFCPYEITSKNEDFQLMDWNLYKKIIDECSEHDVKTIHPFLMSEPLLNPNLDKYINYAKEKNQKTTINIFTNGSLLTKKNSEKLLNSKIDEVIFSFNGATKETYEKEMKNLDFEKTKERITNFIKLAKEKKPSLQIAVHMLKLSIEQKEVEIIKNYWNSLGVAVHLHKFENRGGNVSAEDAVSNQGVKKIPCSRLFNQIYILANGDVILCCVDWKKEVILGNLKENSIKEVWNNNKYKNYQQKHLEGKYSELKLCNVCNYNEVLEN